MSGPAAKLARLLLAVAVIASSNSAALGACITMPAHACHQLAGSSIVAHGCCPHAHHSIALACGSHRAVMPVCASHQQCCEIREPRPARDEQKLVQTPVSVCAAGLGVTPPGWISDHPVGAHPPQPYTRPVFELKTDLRI